MAVERTEASARTLIAVAATGALVGVAFSVSGHDGLGAYLTVGTLVLLLVGLHRFGRSGPDGPIDVQH